MIFLNVKHSLPSIGLLVTHGSLPGWGTVDIASLPGGKKEWPTPLPTPLASQAHEEGKLLMAL